MTLLAAETAEVEANKKPRVHTFEDFPLCKNCKKLNLTFFDPECSKCLALLKLPETTVAQIFAIMRQWIPQVQQNIRIFGEEVLKRGAHVDDRDGLTDMTLLHYACKAGADGIGSSESALDFVNELVERGAGVDIRCRWNNMAALHYSVYFNVLPLVEFFLQITNKQDIESRCSEFEDGTLLHIAAAACSYEAAKSLLQYGASSTVKDNLGRLPVDCIPARESLTSSSELANNAVKLKQLLSQRNDSTPSIPSPDYDHVTGKVILTSMGLQLGDRVTVAGVKSGILSFSGTTHFASGQWAGIQLDTPTGRNDGSVDGISYFTCPSKHGIFAPLSKVTKHGQNRTLPVAATQKEETQSVGEGASPVTPSYKVDVSHVTARVDTGLRRSQSANEENIQVGDRVSISGQRVGVVQFSGHTKFAPGLWYGIELDEPNGKNDGSVSGIRYFTCDPKRGVFAPPSRIKKLSEDDIENSNYYSLNKTFPEISKKNNENSRRRISSTSGSMSGVEAVTTTSPAIGSSVYLNGELGTVRYSGPVHFSDGSWLGIELRVSKGKNDGSVQGKRYFSCKPNYGLMVRPGRVTEKTTYS